MNNHKYYTTTKNKMRVSMIISMLILAGMICLNVFVKEPEPQADTVHPFVNVNVNWEQSFHTGSWGE